MSFQPCRRQFLALSAGVAAAGTLAACGSADQAPEEGTVLGETSQVPVGAAIPVMIGEVPIILAHTPEGEFRAFSAVCPHQGCKVMPPQEQEPDLLVCPCHRSEFETYTGKVLRGPATEDLSEFEVEVRDGRIVTL